MSPYSGGSPLHPENPLHKLQNIDADNTGTANVPIEDCYYINDEDHPATYDHDVVFLANNYAVCNVYLQRKVYS